MISRLTVCLLLNCLASAQLPDPKLTPGLPLRSQNAYAVCTEPTSKYRHTTDVMKREVCQRYHVISICPARNVMEIDHLVPLELGGADVISNLWPQYARYKNGPGFAAKDRLENVLRYKVCHHELSLREAQDCIRINWIKCYKKQVKQ